MLERLKTLHINTEAFIAGNFVKTKHYIEKISSFSQKPLPKISACDEYDINKAVEVALRAYKMGVWRDLPPAVKKQRLLKLAELMERYRDELAILDSYETSRSYKNYYYDSIPKAIEALRYFAESVDKYYDRCIPPRKNEFAIITRVPLGVVGLITPWNDPLVVSVWKFAPALLMGNSVIIKPAEQSSLSILKVALLAKEADIPDGVFNVCPGFGHIAGKALALHNDVSGVFFTGSTKIGKEILKYSGLSNMKKVELECGGKSPFIISKHCKNLKETTMILAKNIFYNQGQICSAPSRVIIDKEILKPFLKILKEESKKYIPKNPYSLESEVGCIVSNEQFNKVLDYINVAKKEGADIFQSKCEIKKGVCAIAPTIITNISLKSKIWIEEIFGPVVCVVSVNDIKEAIDIANDTSYGLSAAIFSTDISEIYQASLSLEAGLVHINSYGDDDNQAPFGGFKQSGLGKDKSIFAFDEYSQIKTIWMKI